MAKNTQNKVTVSKNDAKQPKATKGVHRIAPNTRIGWFIAACTLVLLLAVGAYVVARIVDDKDTSNTVYNEPENPRFPKEEVRLEQLDFAVLQDRVGKLELSNQYTDAKRLVKYQDYYKENKQTQLLYASLCANQGNQKEALQTMLAIEKKFGASGNLAGSIAQQAVVAGDKKTGVKYYEKAIELTEKDKSNPVRGADAKLYKEELKKLEGN